MAYSIDAYVVDGSTDTFTPTYPYLSRQHIVVTVDGVEVTYTWLSTTQIQLDTMPPNGASVAVKRVTPSDAPMADFQDSSMLDEETLDIATLQTFYIAQELYDVALSATDSMTAGLAEASGYRDEVIGMMEATQNLLDAAQVLKDECQVLKDGTDTLNTEATASALEASNAQTAAEVALASAEQVLVDVETEGNTQVARIVTEGNTQDARVENVGDTQVSRVETLVDSIDINKSVRQAILTGPDLEPTPDTIETSATKSGDLRDTYHDLGMDMLTGSKGGMVLSKVLGVGKPIIQSSVLPRVRDRLRTSESGVMAESADILQQFTSSGLQIGNEGTYNSANLVAFQTTHSTQMSDGSYWHYNPLSGFAQCVYTGTGVDRDLLHPMGMEPLFWVIKAMNSTFPWLTGRRSSLDFMLLSDNNIESYSDQVWLGNNGSRIITGPNININTNGANHFLFGWFGDPLDDLRLGMAGMRGVTASWVSEDAETVDTGITNIQCILRKRIDDTGDWMLLNKASGWGNFTILNDTDTESTQSVVSVSGSEVTMASTPGEYLMVVVGSTVVAPSTRIKQGIGVVRKEGNETSGHRVDLGHDFVSGDNGGMVMGRRVETANNNFIVDTIRGPSKYLITNDADVEGTSATLLEGFTTTGITVGSNNNLNGTEINQYTVFGTTHKTTTSDGLEWQYNPLTGFAMCKYTGDGVAGRTLTHPMGKKLRMGWFKEFDNRRSWRVYMDTLGATKRLTLDETYASLDAETAFNDTEPTDTTITLGSDTGTNEGGYQFMFYGWFGDDSIPGADPGVTGQPGVSAFWFYEGGSGAMEIDTGLPDVALVLLKKTDGEGDWSLRTFGESKTKLKISTTDVEDVEDNITARGDTVIWDGSSYSYTLMAFSSGALSGIDDQVILPASPTDPHIVSMADGFNIKGNQDIIRKVDSQVSLTVTGDPGKKFIYVDQSGVLGFTSTRPEYLRDAYPSGIGWQFDINKAHMLKDGIVTPVVFLGECTLGALGNVYDIVSYAPGDSWESFWFSPVIDDTQEYPNPFGHTQVDVGIYGYSNSNNLNYEETPSTVISEFNGTLVGVTPKLASRYSDAVYQVRLRRGF